MTSSCMYCEDVLNCRLTPEICYKHKFIMTPLEKAVVSIGAKELLIALLMSLLLLASCFAVSAWALR